MAGISVVGGKSFEAIFLYFSIYTPLHNYKGKTPDTGEIAPYFHSLKPVLAFYISKALFLITYLIILKKNRD